MTLTIGSLFSGVGGLELGLENAGLGPVRWQVEIDAFRRQVLAKHWPAAARFSDVHFVDAAQLEPVDLVCGGFPCTDISVANPKRTGLAGARSGLWREFRRIVEAVKPRWVVVENVLRGWRDWLPVVRRDLGRLGYASLPVALRASELGAWHARARVFVVADVDGFADWRGEGLGEHARRGGAGRTSRSGIAADADGDVLRHEPRRGGGARGRRAGVPRHAGKESWRRTQPEVGLRVHGLPAGLVRGGVDGPQAATGRTTVVPPLWAGARTEAIPLGARGRDGVRETEVLRPRLYGGRLCQRHRAAELEAKEGATVPWGLLRVLWGYDESALPPHRRESRQRLADEHPDLVRELSRFAPPPCATCWLDGSWADGLEPVIPPPAARMDRRARAAREAALGDSVVPPCAEIVGTLIAEMMR